MGGQSPVAYNADDLQNTATSIDSLDMTESIQEALHRSTMDMSVAEYVRKEVRFQVLPTKVLLKLDSPLTSFVDMQHVLFEEERSAFKNAIVQNMRDGKIHPLTYIHHASTYQASLCKLMECCLSPAVNALHDRLKENEIRLAMLMEEANSLELEVGENERKLESPRRLAPRGLRGNVVIEQGNAHISADPGYASSPSGVGGRRKAS